MNKDKNISLSVVIPTFNEGKDIKRLLDSLISQTHKANEIIVVDDSTDETPSIVDSYKDKGVILIHREINSNGCCGARNLGIIKAKSDIVVILDADTFPYNDFLERILLHFKNGADYVLVETRVANDSSLFPRFIEAQHRCNYDGEGNIQWTGGISFKRLAGIDVGLFTGDFPLNFCRDSTLGTKLSEKGYKRVIDRSIIVPHTAPSSFLDFWKVGKTRGRFGSFYKYFLQKTDIQNLLFYLVGKSLLIFLKIVLIFPILIKGIVLSRYSSGHIIKDVFLFSFAYETREISLVIGGWEGFSTLIKYFYTTKPSKLRQ